MPSPFPGMDPWLENPLRWPGVHHAMITYIRDDLNTTLPGGYVALIQERLVVEGAERSIFSDLDIRQSPQRGANGAASSAAVCDPPVRFEETAEIREGFIEIVPVDDESKVVTLIEILSPSNKNTRSTGCKLYAKKQRETLASATHLLEIDLLRAGPYTVATPVEFLAGQNHWDYIVSLSRSDSRPCWETWPFSLRQRLPRIAVPLLPGTPDVAVDLQAVLDKTYDLGRYTDIINYKRPPRPPLEDTDALWAEHILREKDLIPGQNGQ